MRVIACAVGAVVSVAAAAGPQSPPVPDALVDLTTAAGLDLVGAQWRVHEAPLVEVESRTKAGEAARTHDLGAKAGAADFDDASWEVLGPERIHARLGPGRLSFEWLRVRIRVPEKIGGVSTEGASLVLNTTVDDYAEVWVDGRLPLVPGGSGGPVVRGWNAPSRVLLSGAAHAGQTICVAILAANGPLSSPPENFIWLRSATLDVYRSGRLAGAVEAPLRVVRTDAGLDAVIGPGARLEKLAAGFSFTEGPVWHPGGFLLFSDPNQNVIHRYDAAVGEVSVYMANSGFAGGADAAWGGEIGLFKQPGSNGLAVDREGRLTICQHGLRRVVRIEANGDVTVLADRYRGKRLNSPNDLVYRSDGTLFFTDPPFGLPGFGADPRRELGHSGVYCVYNGELRLLTTDLEGPNGIAFSTDERFVYVTNWDERRKVVRRYACGPDGTLSDGRDFFSMQGAPEPEALDGVKVDARGNLFVSGPGGVWVIDSAGKHLGTLVCPELPANMAWGPGGASGGELYLTARTGVYRLRMGR